MSAAQQRKILRAAHLGAAVLLAGILIAPITQYLHLALSLVFLVVLVFTGVAMWQAPRIRRLVKAGGRKGVLDTSGRR